MSNIRNVAPIRDEFSGLYTGLNSIQNFPAEDLFRELLKSKSVILLRFLQLKGILRI